MFAFVKKKKLDLPKNNGPDEVGEEIEAPDADGALADIDAALKAADAENEKARQDAEKKAFEDLRARLLQNYGGGCACG